MKTSQGNFEETEQIQKIFTIIKLYYSGHWCIGATKDKSMGQNSARNKPAYIQSPEIQPPVNKDGSTVKCVRDDRIKQCCIDQISVQKKYAS